MVTVTTFSTRKSMEVETVKVHTPLYAIAALVLLTANPSTVSAQEKVVTFWNKLGIPQACHAACDALVNRCGRLPQLERKPPLLAIADPANLESAIPAIKVAADVKMDQDLKKQKIKAIRYLAKIGCGCYPDVKEALLAALEDCSEDIRREAALAFAKAAGDPCTVCNADTCCDPDVIAKLTDMAEGCDEKGCYKEPSPRVRVAAMRALNACRMIVPAQPVAPLPKEVPMQPELAPELDSTADVQK